MKQAYPQRIVTLLHEYDDILIASHVNPDGDAVGSSMALAWLLHGLGKRVALYNATGYPPHLQWVSLPGEVYESLQRLPFKPKLVVCLDCGDLHRLGEALAAALPRYASINIDHHLGNGCFASLENWVDHTMASTGQMVAAIAQAAGVELKGSLAEGIYLSLVTDTGSFSHGNTTPEVLELAASLIRQGLDASELRGRMDSQSSLARVHFLGALFSAVRLEDRGRIAVSLATEKMFAQTGAQVSDTEGYIEQLRCIAGVRVALFIREEGKKRVKVSLRSRGVDDVRAIAAKFGGGGHKNAAGATLNVGMQEAQEILLAAVHEMLGD